MMFGFGVGVDRDYVSNKAKPLVAGGMNQATGWVADGPSQPLQWTSPLPRAGAFGSESGGVGFSFVADAKAQPTVASAFRKEEEKKSTIVDERRERRQQSFKSISLSSSSKRWEEKLKQNRESFKDKRRLKGSNSVVPTPSSVGAGAIGSANIATKPATPAAATALVPFAPSSAPSAALSATLTQPLSRAQFVAIWQPLDGKTLSDQTVSLYIDVLHKLVAWTRHVGTNHGATLKQYLLATGCLINFLKSSQQLLVKVPIAALSPSHFAILYGVFTLVEFVVGEHMASAPATTTATTISLWPWFEQHGILRSVLYCWRIPRLYESCASSLLHALIEVTRSVLTAPEFPSTPSTPSSTSNTQASKQSTQSTKTRFRLELLHGVTSGLLDGLQKCEDPNNQLAAHFLMDDLLQGLKDELEAKSKANQDADGDDDDDDTFATLDAVLPGNLWYKLIDHVANTFELTDIKPVVAENNSLPLAQARGSSCIGQEPITFDKVKAQLNAGLKPSIPLDFSHPSNSSTVEPLDMWDPIVFPSDDSKDDSNASKDEQDRIEYTARFYQSVLTTLKRLCLTDDPQRQKALFKLRLPERLLSLLEYPNLDIQTLAIDILSDLTKYPCLEMVVLLVADGPSQPVQWTQSTRRVPSDATSPVAAQESKTNSLTPSTTTSTNLNSLTPMASTQKPIAVSYWMRWIYHHVSKAIQNDISIQALQAGDFSQEIPQQDMASLVQKYKISNRAWAPLLDLALWCLHNLMIECNSLIDSKVDVCNRVAHALESITLLPLLLNLAASHKEMEVVERCVDVLCSAIKAKASCAFYLDAKDLATFGAKVLANYHDVPNIFNWLELANLTLGTLRIRDKRQYEKMKAMMRLHQIPSLLENVAARHTQDNEQRLACRPRRFEDQDDDSDDHSDEDDATSHVTDACREFYDRHFADDDDDDGGDEDDEDGLGLGGGALGGAFGGALGPDHFPLASGLGTNAPTGFGFGLGTNLGLTQNNSLTIPGLGQANAFSMGFG